MNRDEKLFRVIDNLQQGIKLVVELATKGIVFHLGITAFSATFAFDRTPTAKTAIIVMNLLVNFFAGTSIVLAAKAINNKRERVVALYDELGIDIAATPGRRSSLTPTPWYYAGFCAVLAIFWVVSFWLPAKPPLDAPQPPPQTIVAP